jgi:type I restriction enzyme R subunit
LEALEKIQNISTQVVTHTENDIPEALIGRDMARRYYGQVREKVAEYGDDIEKPATEAALQIVDRITPHKIRDWRTNTDAINKMRGEIDDILFDVMERSGIQLSLNDQDAIIDKCIEIAIANEE